VDYLMLENGWTFSKDNPDHLFGSDYLYQIYLRADANYSGRVTVPVLWDKHKQTIVSNESSEIIRMFNSAFDDIGAAAGDYYPAALRTEIDAINDQIYQAVNNGVYRAGFATTQQAYEEAVEQLFGCLNELDELLKHQDYLVGNQLSEADWRLFTTLIRFDAVYVGHFKCNLKRIADYPNLSRYLRRLLKVPGVRDTIDMTHIKRHYYMSHKTINPSGIVPLGPNLSYLGLCGD
jgi:putative glutathione S-transferase